MYGSLADARGRKIVLFFSILGQMLALLWIVGVCKFVGPFTSPNIASETMSRFSEMDFTRRVDLGIACVSPYWRGDKAGAFNDLHCTLRRGSVGEEVGCHIKSVMGISN